MQDLQITALWFVDEKCQTLTGQGKIWKSLKAQLESLSVFRFDQQIH